MKRPSVNDLYLAARWLDINEDAEDAAACKRVSEWLDALSDKAEHAQRKEK